MGEPSRMFAMEEHRWSTKPSFSLRIPTHADQLVVGTENEAQHPQSRAAAQGTTHAHSNWTDPNAGANAPAAAAALPGHPIGHRVAVGQPGDSVRRPQLHHRLVVGVVANPAVPIDFGGGLATRQQKAATTQQQNQSSTPPPGNAHFHVEHYPRPARMQPDANPTTRNPSQ